MSCPINVIYGVHVCSCLLISLYTAPTSFVCSDDIKTTIMHCLNETPTVRGLAADNNNKLYTETMIFLWNNHCNLNFIM